jgi:phage shock protein PspC (stress-responsive transcriptional regulator)
MNGIRNIVEFSLFGVCTAIGEKMNLSIAKIRMWFIYISFLTFGSPIIIYFILSFWRNMRRYHFFSRRNPVKWI